MPTDRNDPDSAHESTRIPGGFRAAFTSAVMEAGFTVKQWQGSSVICTDSDGEDRTLSLSNVYRRCQNAPREDWSGIIEEFVRHMAAATKDGALPESLNDAIDQLLPRVGLPFPKNLGDGVPWHKPLGDTGLVITLVIDHPNFMSYIGNSLISESGRSAEEWLEIANRNLLRQTSADYLTSVGEEIGILLGCSNDAYDAARSLVLDELLPESTRLGFFVAVPTRDVLVVLPVDAQNLIHVHVLKRFAEDNCKSRPYPISDEVFWVRGGEWHKFPVRIVKDTIQVTPPEAFMEVLEELNPPDDDLINGSEPDEDYN